MERIALAEEYYDLVKQGIKTSTIRYGKRLYKLGEGEFYTDVLNRTLPINIIESQYKTFGELTEADAIQDGFTSLEGLRNALLRFYPGAKDEDEVTKVIFEGRQEGIYENKI